jgi:TetR/AcrR family transcriptional regulator, transcriptional repressor of bet genes
VSARRKKSETVPRARSAHGRQRQRLIDACISALHMHGPSRTTVAKVVAIAKMSPGIVRFYFDSKAAMLVASLQFLSAEFEEQVLVPVARLKANPVAALELLVDLYLDPEIASPRKVSVWYAFWGEASSRQEYYDICGQKDENFAALVHELIGALIEESGQPHLDPGGVALGLIGALEMMWQDFAFRSEADIDRKAAKRRCMAYLESVFPGRFAPLPAGPRSDGRAADGRLAGWVYGSEGAAALEREGLFRGAWQIAAHESQIARAGDFLGVDLGIERVLLVRDAFGSLRAWRNSCPELPHALVEEKHGRFEASIECRVHRIAFGWDGRRTSGGAAADLDPLEIAAVEGLVAVRARDGVAAAEPWLEGRGGWLEGRHLTGLKPASADVREGDADAAAIEVAANWKLVVEQWLEHATLEVAPSPEAASVSWGLPAAEEAAGGQRHRAEEAVVGQRHRKSGDARGGSLNETPLQRFVAPNQLLSWRSDGVTILQAIPVGAARCRVRRLDLARGGIPRAAAGHAERPAPWDPSSIRGIAESAQRGVLEFGYRAAAQAKASPAVAWFRRHLALRVPALALERPPNAF